MVYGDDSRGARILGQTIGRHSSEAARDDVVCVLHVDRITFAERATHTEDADRQKTSAITNRARSPFVNEDGAKCARGKRKPGFATWKLFFRGHKHRAAWLTFVEFFAEPSKERVHAADNHLGAVPLRHKCSADF